jgi:hypothetical protein
MARTPFSGVRISWLMVARNCERALSAAWASRSARSSEAATRVISSAWARLSSLEALSSDSRLPVPT